jgi:hypothetical protein
VPGLLSYREDNEKLYVNKGDEWDAIGSEKEVSESIHQGLKKIFSMSHLYLVWFESFYTVIFSLGEGGAFFPGKDK